MSEGGIRVPALVSWQGVIKPGSTCREPIQSVDYAPTLLGLLAVISVIYGAGLSMVQNDLKKMVAYSSVNHMGYCLLGMAAVLTVSANGVETSPVTRGAWVSENILGIKPPPPPDVVPAIEPDVTINNQWSNRYTVIEVTGLDRPGLLYELTATLSKLSLNITSAHVATFGERVVDVFYVTDLLGAKLSSPTREIAIKRALLQLFGTSEESGKETATARAGAAAK